jgi:uncharacterized protein
MKNAIILHGGPSREEYYDPQYPSASNSHWFPWLQKQLLIHDIPTATPEVPWAFDRNWEVWNREVERFDIGPETILVGHSTGAGFWVKYLSIHPKICVDKVILVAPWLDPGNIHTKDFFDDFEIDPRLAERTKQLTIFNSDDDEESIQQTTTMLKNIVKGLQYKEFHNYGHFTAKSLKSLEFPELLEVIL